MSLTEVASGSWYDYSWVAGYLEPASKTGVLALGYVPATEYIPLGTDYSKVTIGGSTQEFTLIDLTECEQSVDPEVKYRGGIQSVDKSFSASPILVPIPRRFAEGYDIGFIESAVITIAGVWFDGLRGRDMIIEDIRTSQKCIDETKRGHPLVLILSERAYFVFITGYSSNIVGGNGNIISFRLGLSICSGTGHYT